MRPPLARSLASQQDASGASIVETISQSDTLAEWPALASRARQRHLLAPGMADNSRGRGDVSVVQAEADVTHLIRWSPNLSSLCCAPLIARQCDFVLQHMDGDVDICLRWIFQWHCRTKSWSHFDNQGTLRHFSLSL